MENNKAVLFELNIENDRCIFPNTISDAIIDANKELKDLEDKLNETLETIRLLTPECDKLDYILSASSGALCGIMDVFLVGKPGESPLGDITDKWFANRTIDFAKICGYNVDVEKIKEVFQHFIVMHDEPLFFILELPVTCDRENPVAPGILEETHKDVYYIDGCSQEECLVLLERYGELLINDGMNRFGYGCHESQDEIMLDKYNVVTIYSQQLSNYNDFFEAHGIEKVESLITAWDTFSDATPGQAERCDYEGKSVYDLPEELEDWGMYLADTRAE